MSKSDRSSPDVRRGRRRGRGLPGDQFSGRGGAAGRVALAAGDVDPVFWLVPLAAVVVSGLALRRIAVRWPELVGRPAALAGLMLGVAMLVAAPVDDLVYRYLLRQQAREFAEMWIDAVRHGEVYKPIN